MKKVVSLLLVGLVGFFIFPMANAFANRALDQINGILANRINVDISVEKGGTTIEKAIGIGNTTKTTKEINSSNVDSIEKNYEFVFFYKSSCPYCRKFDSILKQYSIDMAIPVRAFTFDGISLPSFPNSAAVDKNTVNEYFGASGGNMPLAVPALFLMNTVNLHVYPVSSGALSYMDLAMRMNALVPKILSVERSQHV